MSVFAAPPPMTDPLPPTQIPAPSDEPFITIQAGAKPFWNLKELWADREVLRSMVWRDIAVRYKETVIGFLWVVLQPIMMMVILSTFFRHLSAGTDTRVPIHVRVLSSLLIWDFIAMSIERAGTSLLYNSHVVSKVYFCRLILPLTPIGASGFDFFIKFGLLAVLMAWYGLWPTTAVLALPLVMACTLLFTMSLCIWLAALTAFYKDVALTIPFALRALFFLSPVFYQAQQVVSPRYADYYHLNPFAALIESFNYLLLGTDCLPIAGLAMTLVVSLVLLAAGTTFFRHVETSIVDVL